jgi:hypothetical protein
LVAQIPSRLGLVFNDENARYVHKPALLGDFIIERQESNLEVFAGANAFVV